MTTEPLPQMTAAGIPQANRVLIYRLGSLGDTLIALPALNLVAHAFPRAERRMLTNFPVNVKASPAAAILEHTGLVHRYFRYAVGTRRPFAFARLWWSIVRWRPDVLVYLGSSRGVASAQRDERFFRLCGIRRIIGAPTTADMQQHRWDEVQQVFEPEAARLARNIAVLGDAHLEDPANWGLHLTEEERERAVAALDPLAGRPVIVVSVGTKQQSKDWGRENWRELMRHVSDRFPQYGLALCGSTEERQVSEYVAEGWRESREGSAIVNLCGRLTPRETAAVCEKGSLFLGHDSGPMHLAAAVQTPCVAVFSARNKPRVWFPWGSQHRVIYHRVDCWGCNLQTCVVQQKKCIYSITVEEVLAEICSLLQEPGQESRSLAEGVK